jgi:hypothetical protein
MWIACSFPSKTAVQMQIWLFTGSQTNSLSNTEIKFQRIGMSNVALNRMGRRIILTNAGMQADPSTKDQHLVSKRFTIL